MSRLALIGCSVLLIAVAAALLQRNALFHARSENHRLLREIEKARRAPLPDKVEPITSAESNAMAKAREALRDLPRLRNEVRQLRDGKHHLAGLRAENETLTKRVEEALARRQAEEPSAEHGFVMNETWGHAGFGSPEAAVQSFFCALRDGNVPNLLACITPESAMAMGVNRRTGEIRPGSFPAAPPVEGLRALGKIKGYRIVETEVIAQDQAKVKVQAAVNGETLDLQLALAGQEWKIDMR